MGSDVTGENRVKNVTGAQSDGQAKPGAATNRKKTKGQKPKKAKKTQPKQKTSTKKTKTSSRSKGRGPTWTFPRDTLEDAIRIAKGIEDKHAGNPMDAPMLAKAVGFKRANDWRFLQLLQSANQYALVSGSGASATVSLEQIGRDVVAPSTPDERQRALLDAFNNVDDFRNVAEFYSGKRIPEDEFFSNTLTRQFTIPRDRVEKFIEVFLGNRQFLKGFDAPIETVTAPSPQVARIRLKSPEVVIVEETPPTSRVRQFLDSSFVMMPFGEWSDRYYKEIYVPAIKEAGLEPVRADELFHSGSVIEQIWDQIRKSKVLLADMTGRNANVFYELGLAHALGKPVVFISANVDDIPFDLRHLRTIIYDVREPGWDAKLRRNITAHLKNAGSEPDKAVPQPFRDSIADADESDE